MYGALFLYYHCPICGNSIIDYWEDRCGRYEFECTRGHIINYIEENKVKVDDRLSRR